jgi:hypothetical protein
MDSFSFGGEEGAEDKPPMLRVRHPERNGGLHKADSRVITAEYFDYIGSWMN